MSNDVNFKRLDELEVIESSAENAHVLAEVNGVPKRIPASSVGGGSNDDGGGTASPIYEVEVVIDINSGENTSSKTRAEIGDAFVAGLIPIVRLIGVMGEIRMPMATLFNFTYDMDAVHFSGYTKTFSDENVLARITITDDGVTCGITGSTISFLTVDAASSFFLRSETNNLMRIVVKDDGSVTAKTIR